MKKFFLKIIFFFLSRAIRAVVKLDYYAKKELDNFDESYVIKLKIWPEKPSICFIVKNNSFKKSKKYPDADLTIYFKSIESALLLLTGKMSIEQGYSEHRFLVKGDLFKSMSFIRILHIVEYYLFPKFITNKILYEKPSTSSNKFRVYLKILFGI